MQGSITSPEGSEFRKLMAEEEARRDALVPPSKRKPLPIEWTLLPEPGRSAYIVQHPEVLGPGVRLEDAVLPEVLAEYRARQSAVIPPSE